MIGHRLSCFVKVVIGVLLLQVVTVLLVIAALRSNLNETVPLFVLVGGLVGFLSALWFSSIYSDGSKLAVSQAREGFSKEREKLRVKAEKEKARLMVSGEKRAAKDARGSGGGGVRGIGLKGNTAVVGAVGIGAVLLFSQFVTLGLAALAAVGGSMVGYKVRSFQEQRSSNNQLARGDEDLKMIADRPPVKPLPRVVKRLDKDS